MMLRGNDFSTVWGASGVQGFFGEGYQFHDVLKLAGLLDFDGITFVAKTTTLPPRPGNMPLRTDFRPKEWFPKCVKVKPFQGIGLNSVGLSGPGAETLFRDGRWQKRTQPFFLSFMSVAQTAKARLQELADFVRLFKTHLPDFRAKVGLQINYSCPNVGLHIEELVEEVEQGFEIVWTLNVPIVPKFNILLPVEAACRISERLCCDALCMTNTIPYGQLPERINWKKLFGSNTSPLAHLGGGGLSGKPLLPLLLEWLSAARSAGMKKPVNAGGGILSLQDAQVVMRSGADSIFLGSIAFLRPRQVKKIIREFNGRR